MFKRILLIAICAIAMVLIRLFQTELFYDPISTHFSQLGTTSYKSVHVNLVRWSVSSSLRFILHGLGCCIIITALSNLTEGFRYFRIYLSFLPFILGINLIVYGLLDSPFFLFYTLRLLIQPIIGLVLIGSFYYNKRSSA